MSKRCMIVLKSNLAINRQPRNPEKFDLLDLFDAIGRDKKYILGDEKDEAAFVDIIRNALSVNKTPTMIYGRRIEAMFAYMAASLGKCALVKKEDCGDVFAGDGSIEIPDYRIVLNSNGNEHMLVEVKNYHQKNVFNEYTMNLDYLDGLSRYADLVKTVLRIAIYWSKWCIWTLVSPADFERNGTKVIISLSTAMKRNQMSVLGDVMIGTTPPLSMRIYCVYIQINSIHIILKRIIRPSLRSARQKYYAKTHPLFMLCRYFISSRNSCQYHRRRRFSAMYIIGN